MNPFNPTFGDVPDIFLSSDTSTTKLVKTIKQSSFSRTFFITGVRGAGKTAFVTKVCELLESDPNCIYLDLLNKNGLLTSFAQQLDHKLHSPLIRSLGSVRSLSIGSFGLSRESDPIEVDLWLDTLMQEVAQTNKYVVICIDEVTNSKAITDFAQVYSSLKRKKYPLFVLMTGLPDLVLDIQNNDKLTFLLRSEKITMSPLEKSDMIYAYQQTFACSAPLASKLVQMTKGYAYAFQLLGYLLYEQCQGQTPTEKDVAAIKLRYQTKLFDNAYQKIYTSLSEIDRQYLQAVAKKRKFSAVVELMGKDKVFVSQYRRRALERHLIVPTGYGYVAYTLPYFEDYLMQARDPDSAYYLGY